MGAGDQPTDGHLVLLARNGNLEAFNSLVERYEGAVFGLCLRILGNRESAEDATQEAFISAYRAIERFEGGNIRSWLLRIGANQARDELRRGKRRAPSFSLSKADDDPDAAPFELPDTTAGAERLLLDREFGHEIEALLAMLPAQQRQAVVLVDVYDFAYDEVATMTQATLGTVKSRVFRGRERLRELVVARPELFGRLPRQKDRTP